MIYIVIFFGTVALVGLAVIIWISLRHVDRDFCRVCGDPISQGGMIVDGWSGFCAKCAREIRRK